MAIIYIKFLLHSVPAFVSENIVDPVLSQTVQALSVPIGHMMNISVLGSNCFFLFFSCILLLGDLENQEKWL